MAPAPTPENVDEEEGGCPISEDGNIELGVGVNGGKDIRVHTN